VDRLKTLGPKKRSRIQKVIISVIIALVAIASFYGVMFLLTPYSGVARGIIWMEADIKDYEKFPARTMNNAPPVFNFGQADAVLQSKYLQALDRIVSQSSFNEFLSSTATTAFLIIKDDQLIYENYFNGYQRDSINTSFSVSKSFVSALVGVAIDEKSIDSINEPITRYIPELEEKDSRYSAITIEHLLSMTSGLKYDDDGMFDDGFKTYYDPDLRAVALSAVIEEEPGKAFHYNNYNYLLLGIILERATGMPVQDYTEEKLWKQLGMEALGSWSIDSESSGFAKMESGLNARAIDFAKFGRLYLNNGNWDGKQLISEQWVQDSTRAEDPDPYPLFRWNTTMQYQYGWWIYPAQNGNPAHHYAWGNHGQFIYVVPEKSLIMVRHGYEHADVNWVDLFERIAMITS
jgi:CubicO group peptidase (beta-lactamase class C family)